MTQEQKELLFKDLCMRLPYGVNVDVINEDNEHRIVKIGEGNIGHLGKGFWKECKPYLFPFSSMTEEQKKELNDITNLDIEIAISHIKNDTPNYVTSLNRLNWLLKNHFDIYDLIPMGLANDATDKNIY